MKCTALDLPDVLLIEPDVFHDTRGFFLESFNQHRFHEVTGLDVTFVQDNLSRSRRHVLRGLHYQLPPHAQGKLIQVVRGKVFDVAVDIRAGSPSFGRWTGTKLSDGDLRQLWIPPGFAHGFLVLSEQADLIYKTTAFYTPTHERSIAWNDPAIGIAWPLSTAPLLNHRDTEAGPLAEAECFP